MATSSGWWNKAAMRHIFTDMGDFYIDLVFYNYLLKCFVLIDLKKGQITHQDVGQMDMYVRMYDDMKPTEEELHREIEQQKELYRLQQENK